MDLFIIDALSPFIDSDRLPTNWSKVPFEDYDEKITERDFQRIVENFELFAKRAAAEGYNAVSIDELSRLATLPIYPENLKEKLRRYEKLYTAIFSLAKKYGLKIFVNFDLMYFNADIEKYTQNKDSKIIEVIKESLDYLFNNYPVDGIITRVGECDGVDIKGIFKSRLTIKNATQARKYLNRILPVLEEKNKLWIFRTWSIGAYKIGDLMWNKKTFFKVFKNIQSDSLIISMKYGETDFYRNLELNPLFELGSHNMICELQARREYDGFGELPYYTGWDYENYYKKLKNHSHIKGIMVWCQSGGWKKSHRINFLKNSSPWVELNTISTIRIFKDGKTAAECAVDYFEDQKIIEFLKKYNAASGKIMYPALPIKVYLGKVRIPPVTWIFWDNIAINNLTMSYFKYVLKDHKNNLTSCREEIDEVFRLGQACQIENIAFIRDTLDILLLCRKTLAAQTDSVLLKKNIDSYNRRYPTEAFKFTAVENLVSKKRLRILFYLLLRRESAYHFKDFIFFDNFIFLPLLRLYVSLNRKYLPEFVDNQAMSLETFLKH